MLSPIRILVADDHPIVRDGLVAVLSTQPDFQVVAVNIDTRDPQKPLAFLKDVGITHLAYFSDPSARVFEELKTAGKAFGMPTTIIVAPTCPDGQSEIERSNDSAHDCESSTALEQRDLATERIAARARPQT